MISIVAIGKKHEDWVLPGIERYQKRLKAPFDIKWILLPHSSLEGQAARLEESERLRRHLPERAMVVLLDERGKQYDSPDLSNLLDQASNHSQDIIFVIGGAYGVDEGLMAKASVLLSISPMVFPHQLVRLILTEQIYRSQEISRGGRYHHE